MVDSQMGVEEFVANPANLVRLRMALRILRFSSQNPQKSSASSALAGVGPSTLQPSKPRTRN